MTKKRFKIVDEQFISYYGGTGHKISNEECGFWLWHNKNESQKVCDKLNRILDENEQLRLQLNLCSDQRNEFHRGVRENANRVGKLKKENKQLKIIRSDLASELDIVQNELNIAIDKGFAPSQPYINYMASKKTEYDKFWENKIKTHNNQLKGVRE